MKVRTNTLNNIAALLTENYAKAVLNVNPNLILTNEFTAAYNADIERIFSSYDEDLAGDLVEMNAGDLIKYLQQIGERPANFNDYKEFRVENNT